MSDHHLNLVEAILSGEATPDDFDEWVTRWHDLPEDDPYSKLQLHEYLGLTWDEYQLVAVDPMKLRIIIHQRKTDIENSGDADA